MASWSSWLPGLTDDEQPEEESAVSKTLRMLGQGASDIGAGIGQGVHDLGTGISSAATSAGEALGSAVQAAQPYINPAPNWTPEEAETEAEIERGRGRARAVAASIPPAIAEGARAGAAAADPYLTGPARTMPSWEDPLAPVREVAQHIAQKPLSTVPFFQYADVQQAATDPIGRRAVEAAGGSGTEPAFRATIPESVPFVGGAEIAPTPQDIGGAVGSAVLDPLNLFGAGAAGAAGKGGRTIVAEAVKGLPLVGETAALARGGAGLARRAAGAVGDALEDNAGRLAAADARMLAEGSTLAPAGLGALPEPSGARRGVPTVEVLQDRLDDATSAWRRATEAGDDDMAAIARERAVELQDALVDARNARLDLEPRIRSDVGARVESLPLAEETADTLGGAGSRRIDPDDLGGPMSVLPDLRGRMNATAGALPATRGAGALPAVNRALSEGIAGGVGGAVIEQGRNPDEDPRTAAARGFAVGAVGFPAATRAARGAARLAGAGTDVGGGARIALGDVPPSQIRRPGLPGFETAPPTPIGQAADEVAVPTEALAARFPDVGKALSAAQKRAADMQARGLTPPSWADWVKQFGYSGIFGPATATGQLISGALDVGLAQPKEAIRALTTGTGGRYSAQARAQLEAVPEAWEGLKGILAGSGGSAGAAARSGGAQGTANLSERVVNPVAHLAARALERPGEILAEAPDAVFRPLFNAQGMRREADAIAHELGQRGKQAAATAEQLMQDAKAARANPDQPLVSGEARRIIDAGKAYADEMGYKGDPGGLADWIGKQSKRDDAIGVAASFLFPFSRTPGNIALATARSTPGIGLLPGVRKGRPIKSFDVIYDQAFGTLATSGLAAYATQGGITGTGPDDKAERDAMTAKGWQPRSFLIPGGYYVPNRALGKWGPILDSIGEAHDHLAYRKADAKPGAWTADAIKRIGHIATDQVGLSGLADIMDLIDSAGSGAPGFLGRAATRYTPFGGIIRSVAQATDPTARKPETWAQAGSLGEATLQNIEQSVPGLRQGVAEAQDPLGRPMPNPQAGLGALVPKVTSVRDDPIISAYQAADVALGGPPDEVNGVKLTPEQQRRYQQVRGQEIQRLAGPQVSKGSWAATPPATQKLLLETYKTVAQTLAEAAIANEGGSAFNEARTKAIIEKASGK